MQTGVTTPRLSADVDSPRAKNTAAFFTFFSQQCSEVQESNQKKQVDRKRSWNSTSENHAVGGAFLQAGIPHLELLQSAFQGLNAQIHEGTGLRYSQKWCMPKARLGLYSPISLMFLPPFPHTAMHVQSLSWMNITHSTGIHGNTRKFTKGFCNLSTDVPPPPKCRYPPSPPKCRCPPPPGKKESSPMSCRWSPHPEQRTPPPPQGIRTADNHRRTGANPPPPGPRFHRGKKRNLEKEILIWAIFGTQFFEFQTPPPLLMHASPPPLF